MISFTLFKYIYVYMFYLLMKFDVVQLQVLNVKLHLYKWRCVIMAEVNLHTIFFHLHTNFDFQERKLVAEIKKTAKLGNEVGIKS